MSPPDRLEFERWLAADPLHRELLSTYCQFSADLEQHLPALVAAGAVTMPDVDRAPTRPTRRVGAWGWLTGSGLVAAALTVAVVMFSSDRGTGAPLSLATPLAQRETVTLDDGSVVDLNAHTNLVVEQDAHLRRVRLAGGQAFFQVTKDRSRPFIIETPAGAVRVTGTAFDVRTLSADQLEVTVREGTVQVRLGASDVRPASAPYQLTAGDQLSMLPDGGAPIVRHLSEDAVTDALAWREGRIVFDHAPLSEVLARFAYYHGQGITAAPGAAHLQVSGRYNLDDLEQFFSALEEVLPVQVTHDRSGTTRVIPRS